MLVFFFPFFENLGSYVYDSMRARTVLFLKGISAEKLYGMRARALGAVHACPRVRGRPRRLLLSATQRQRRKVDKCRVADKKQTNKHTLLFYRYRSNQSKSPFVAALRKLRNFFWMCTRKSTQSCCLLDIVGRMRISCCSYGNSMIITIIMIRTCMHHAHGQSRKI